MRNFLRNLSGGQRKLAVTILGCVISVASTVVTAIQKRALEADVAEHRGQLLMTDAEMQRRDRLFDVARELELSFRQARIALYTAAGVKKTVMEPVLASMRKLIADALYWGYEAAWGQPPPKDGPPFQEWAELLVQNEERVAFGRTIPPQEEQTRLTDATNQVSNTVQAQIYEYMSSRNKLIERRRAIRTQIDEDEARVRAAETIGLTLTLIGILVVLLKDLVGKPKPQFTDSAI